MTVSKRMMFINIFLLALSASALWVSCDFGTNGDGDDANGATCTVTYSIGEGGGTAPTAQSGVVYGTSITLPGQAV